MELYIKVSFWAGIVALIIRLLIMAVATWPRTEIKTLGAAVVEVILGLAAVVWAGVLLYNKQ